MESGTCEIATKGEGVNDPASLGVVVIGRNEGDRLRLCLRSVPSGVSRAVYVDSGSTDGSVEAAEALGASVVRLDMSRPFTAARARNAGFAQLTKHPEIAFVQFVDGDCELDADWIGIAMNFLSSRDDVGVVCGRRRERYPGRSVFNQLCDMEWDRPPGETQECGGDFLIRAAAFEEAGGFLAGLIAGEEPELCVRLRARGWRIWRLDADMTRHDAAITRMRQWWTRTVRTGYAFAQVSWLHRHSPHRIWKSVVPRAVFWGGVLPALVVLGSFLHPAVLIASACYPLQVCRIAVKRDASKRQSWTYACFVMIGKFAELRGMVKFCINQLRGRDQMLIEYK